MRVVLVAVALVASGCALDPVPLEGRVCRSYLDCLIGQGYYCQPVDAGDGVDGSVIGICVSLDGSAFTMDAGRDAGHDGGRDADIDASQDAQADADLDADVDGGTDGGADASSDADVDSALDSALDGDVDAARDDADVDGGIDAS